MRIKIKPAITNLYLFHSHFYVIVQWKTSLPTCCSKSTLPAHNQCHSLVPPTVTYSSPESPHTDLNSALTLTLSTNKMKISRAALRLGGGVSLTDNTGYWGRTVAG